MYRYTFVKKKKEKMASNFDAVEKDIISFHGRC